MSSNPPESDSEHLAERRRAFRSDYLEPMVAEACAIGMPMTEVIVRIIEMATLEDEL